MPRVAQAAQYVLRLEKKVDQIVEENLYKLLDKVASPL